MRRIALVLSLAAIAGGCGGGGGTSGGPLDSGAPAAGTAKLKQGGTLTVAAAQGVGRLDPYKSLFAFETTTWPLLWSSLTEYKPDKGAEVQPDLAASWKASDGYRRWRFELRPGLRFSDGRALTATDVAKSLRRAFDPKTAWAWAFLLPKPKRITAVGASTVEVRLAAGSRTYPQAMAQVPIEDVSTLGRIDRDPVVTGPYEVAKFTPDQSLELVPNRHFAGDRPKLDRVVITKAQDNTSAVTALRAGDVQVLWSMPWTDVRRLDSSPDVKVVTAEQPSQNIVAEPDVTSGVFKDVRARQALAHAIDRKSILKAVYGDHGVAPVDNNPIPGWSPAASKGLAPYDFDLAEAKRLFTAAGVTGDTKLTFWTVAGQYPEWTSIGEILQSDLKKIGIKLDIETNELSRWVAKFGPAGKSFPNLIVANAFGGFPPPINLNFWKPGVCECNFKDEDYLRAIADADAAADPALRRRALDRAQAIFHEQVPVVNVVQTSYPVGHVSEVGGVWIDPSNMARFDTAGFVSAP